MPILRANFLISFVDQMEWNWITFDRREEKKQKYWKQFHPKKQSSDEISLMISDFIFDIFSRYRALFF